MRGVKSSRALKYLVLLVFLSLTVGWKVVARATRDGQPTDRSVQVRVAEFLAQQHFNVSMLEQAEQGKPAIAANSGSCRILVIKSPALGWDRDLVRRLRGRRRSNLCCVPGANLRRSANFPGPHSMPSGRGF